MDKVSKTINTLKKLFLQDCILSCGLSGKDSSVVAHCAVEALKQAKEEKPTHRGMLYIVTTNTTIDNFEIHNFILQLHEAAREYAKEYDLPIITKELKPKLFNTPIVEYLGRGKLLRTMQTAARGRDCSVDWKVLPAKEFLSSLAKTHQTDKVISISGTRDAESTARAKNIAKRGESIDVIVKTDLGLALAPIKDWSTNDVWSLIGQIEDDVIESFIDIHAAGLRKHYSAGNGGTCDIYFGNSRDVSKSCGSRFGCTLCSLVESDKSLENQIEVDPDTYGYMTPFVALRKFMNDTLFDNERSRSLLGRDVKHGDWIKVGYNQYSLEYRKELLRYVLTMDANERTRAEALGYAPRFELVDYETLAAIQYHWSREGGESRPAEAIAIWHEVHTYGKRYAISETSKTPSQTTVLQFGSLNFIAGTGRQDYRYANLTELDALFDGERTGLAASAIDKSLFKCHQTVLDGELALVTPFKETQRNSVDAYLAEQYINEAYFDLEAEGAFEPGNDICPTVIIKDMLNNEVITIRKGGMNKLHQDLKRAQTYNAVMKAMKSGSASLVENVVLARSITESEFNTRIAEITDDAEQSAPQMALGF
ncbi:phosphoadenosine phosphosulfate reductase family protein [Pseudoalteromonas sp. MEBiC 03485]|uniref:phosphoadenosine phosphosulfate reductase domain-containing protein n=1 Tax=Pseudoalteromonas sp. MEBiC 03485 TaxID=2571103 RepID=UPI001021E976|nr:phosphoadenosine phosphosulfate reductase family protein [Pseudoalteromonas sp. MEBiC 03485]RZD19765.1 hypothetical protein EVU92_21415 [Pseudoalteromonas sp. MEBiC 03485]